MVVTRESFGPEITQLTDKLYVRRWTPSLQLNDSFSQTFIGAFRRDTFYYFMPRQYQQPELAGIIDEAGLTNATEPAEIAQRESLIAQVNKDWVNLKKLWALKHLAACYKPDCVTWFAYQKEDSEKEPQSTDYCVGYSQWFMPSSLTIRETWSNFFMRKYLDFKLTVMGYWYFGLRENPIFNSRFDRYHTMCEHAEGLAFAHADNDEFLHELASKSTEELTGAGLPEAEKIPYPGKEIVFLSWFCVSRILQGTGIGTKFLSYCMEQIPNQLTEFVSPKDPSLKSYGPQKSCLHATEAGEPFYNKKLGFETVVPYNLGNKYVEMKRNALMVTTRDLPVSA